MRTPSGRKQAPCIHLDTLYVLPGSRCQGIGTRFLAELTALADRTGTVLTLEIGGDDCEPQRAFVLYQNHGFDFDENGSGQMIRFPQSDPEKNLRTAA